MLSNNELINTVSFTASDNGAVVSKWAPKEFGNLILTVCKDFKFKFFSYNIESESEYNGKNTDNELVKEVYCSEEFLDLGVFYDIKFINSGNMDFILVSNTGSIAYFTEKSNFSYKTVNPFNEKIDNIEIFNNEYILLRANSVIKFYDLKLNCIYENSSCFYESEMLDFKYLGNKFFVLFANNDIREYDITEENGKITLLDKNVCYSTNIKNGSKLEILDNSLVVYNSSKQVDIIYGK